MAVDEPDHGELPEPSGEWLRHAPSPMAVVEGATHLVRYTNQAFCRLVNRAPQDLVGKPLYALMPESPECLASLDAVYHTGEYRVLQGREQAEPDPVLSSYVMWPVKTDDRTSGVVIQVSETAPLHARTIAVNEALLLGSLRQHELVASADEANALLQAEIARRIKSENEALLLSKELGEANATLSALATTDALTGLSNRRLFDEQLTVEWQRAMRQRSPLAIVLIDVDNFKKYNDRFGHLAGDQCLRQVAAIISAGQRKVDIAARLGGDEFALLLSATDSGGAAALAERICLAVEQLKLEHSLNDGGVVSISLGIAAGFPAQWSGPEGLLGAADRALYEAKDSGRNQVRTATPDRH